MIGGNSGTAKANKVIKTIFASIMTCELLSSFTWSGRGKGNGKKNSFEKYCNIQKLIFIVLNSVENTYSMSECVLDMKQKIFKYAYLHANKDLLSDVVVINTQDSNNMVSKIKSIDNFIYE